MTTDVNQGVSRPVDLILCIDSTGSMRPVIDEVKDKAKSFYTDLTEKMEELGKNFGQVRIKVIGFRDLDVDGEKSFLESEFFLMPDQTDDFQNFVNEIKADGGGDEPESGLEALQMAIRSDWVKEGVKKRWVIVVWTDASAHVKGNILEEITGEWEQMDSNARRLLIFAPEAEPWNTLANNLSQTVFFPSQAGKGLEEINYAELLAPIADSI